VAKLQISAKDLLDIIEKNQDIYVEILDTAKSQVSETIARRATNEQVKEHVDRCIKEIVQERTGWNTRKLAEPFMTAIEQQIKSSVNDRFDQNLEKRIGQIAKECLQEAVDEMSESLKEEVSLQVREIMRQELASILFEASQRATSNGGFKI
jgi:Ni,Fe-hydrogenase maturation factor